MVKISAGEYSYDEFYHLVIRWRKRYAVNRHAVYPPILSLRFIDNMRITHYKDGVRLEEVE